MKTYFLLILCSFFSSCFICEGNKTIIFDIKNKKNACAEIQKHIAGLEQSPHDLPKTILLPKDRYEFSSKDAYQKELYISNHDQHNPRNIAFLFENLQNITIDAQGSEFIFHGTMIPFVFRNCKNVVLKNVSIDFEFPHIRQLNILEVDTQNNVTIAEIYPKGNYQIENDKLIIVGEDYQRTPIVAMAFDSDKRLSYKRRDVNFTPEKVSQIAPNILKIENWEQNPLTRQGERFALRTYDRPTPGIFIDYCQNISVENVTIHYADGMGLLVQLSENIRLNQFSVTLNPDNQRYFTTQADATHFSACKGLILCENGLYEAMADDAINVHGTYLKVIEKTNSNTIKGRYMHSQAWGFLWGEIGDQVQFVRSNTMEVAHTHLYNIKNIKAVDKPTEFGATIFEITFDRDISQDISFEQPLAIENLTWTPEVIFRNNIIRNNRARGSLFSTPRKVLCENNIFDHTHGTAILLCGDANGWYETGSCREVVIRNNQFINALTANYQFTNAIISIYPEIPNLQEQKRFFHSGISIENNIFQTFDAPILYAKSVEHLIFEKNKIIKNKDFEPFHWNKYPFFFEKINNVSLKYNTIDDQPIQPQDVKIHWSENNSVQISN